MTGIFGNNFGNNWSYFFQAPVGIPAEEVIVVTSTDTTLQASSTDSKLEVTHN